MSDLSEPGLTRPAQKVIWDETWSIRVGVWKQFAISHDERANACHVTVRAIRQMREGSTIHHSNYAMPRCECSNMKPHCFFAHIAFAIDARVHATPQATANLLIEINEKALTSGGKKKHLKVSALRELQKVELAGEIAKTAARAYLKSKREFRKFPVQRFVDFSLVGTPTYISIRPPPAKVLPNDSKVWRLAESEADKLRGEPLSTRYPEIERRLAVHPFLKGMSPHHLELLALSAMPTEFVAGQIIFRAGEPANGFYLIETGTVVLEGKLSDGQQIAIDTVSPGEPLGWSWLFSPHLWQFDARAAESCSAICLSGIMLRQLRDEDLTLSHELFKRMSEVMVRRLQAARGKLISGNRSGDAAIADGSD